MSDTSLRLANREEVQPAPRQDERPLVAFTLLAQLAVGLFLFAASLYTWLMLQGASGSAPGRVTGLAFQVAGLALAVGLLLSLGHLGSPRRAYRALSNLRSSWLSREILFTGLFAAGCAVSIVLHGSGVLGAPTLLITALCGLGLVYSMARVYRQPTIPTWDTWATLASFLLATFLLGSLSLSVILGLSCTGLCASQPLLSTVRTALSLSGILFLALDLSAIWLWEPGARARRASVDRVDSQAQRLYTLTRPAFDLAGIMLLASVLLSWGGVRSFVLAFCLALASAMLGRLQFYALPSKDSL